MCSRDLKPQFISILSKKRQRLDNNNSGSNKTAVNNQQQQQQQKKNAPAEILSPIWSPSSNELRQAIEIVSFRFSSSRCTVDVAKKKKKKKKHAMYDFCR
jgi:hypothetical protein